MAWMVLFLAGVLLGVAVNVAVGVLAWNPRRISPWCRRPLDARTRRWYDFLPIVGWFFLRRETVFHGRFFWVRPMLVEAGMGAFAVWFFPMAEIQINYSLFLYRYVVEMVLVALMLAVSLVDIDEQMIPDTLTVSGTLLALVAALAAPVVLGISTVGVGFLQYKDLLPLDFELAYPWSAIVWGGLAVLIWWGWCFAMMRRVWLGRRGWKVAWAVFCHRLRKTPSTWFFLALGVLGTLGILGVEALASQNDEWLGRWMNLWVALLGLGVSGGMLWSIRGVAALGMRREALGFGDVTLMAMLGAFLGWQASVTLFFLSPMVALVVGLAVLVVCRKNGIPYGPFLCLAAVVVMCGEKTWWPWVLGFFLQLDGTLLLGLAAILLVTMFGLLRLIQLLKRLAGIDY